MSTWSIVGQYVGRAYLGARIGFLAIQGRYPGLSPSLGNEGVAEIGGRECHAVLFFAAQVRCTYRVCTFFGLVENSAS